MFFEIIKVFLIGFTAPFEWLYSAIVELLPTTKFFNDIVGAFSLKSVICYWLGIPAIVLSILTIVIKICCKKQKH